MGRDWLRKIQRKKITGVPVQPIGIAPAELDAMLKKYQEVIVDGLGTMSSVRATLKLKKEALPPSAYSICSAGTCRRRAKQIRAGGYPKETYAQQMGSTQAINVDQYPLPHPTHSHGNVPFRLGWHLCQPFSKGYG